MAGSRQTRKPSFFWQGLLILLPVAVIALVALAALERDRNSVAEEGRQEAAQIAHQLARTLGPKVGVELANVNDISLAWLAYYSVAITDSVFRERDSYRARLAQWQKANPDLRLDEVVPNRLSFALDGSLWWPPDCPKAPQTPAWFQNLTPSQRQAWDALARTEQKGAAWDLVQLCLLKFWGTRPPPEALTNAEFICLRPRLGSQSSSFVELEDLASRYHGLVSETGLPLTSLTAIEILRLMTNAPLSELSQEYPDERFEFPLESLEARMLHWLIEEPSDRTPHLIGELDSLIRARTNNSAALIVPVAAAQTLWLAQERLRAPADYVRQSGNLHPGTPTNFWITSSMDRWFCLMATNSSSSSSQPDGARFLFDPGFRPRFVSDAGDAKAATSQFDIRLYPQAVIARAFANAVRDSGIFIPGYCELELELEHEPLAMDVASKASGPVLAEAEGRIPQAGLLLIRDQPMSDPRIIVVTSGSANQNNIGADSLRFKFSPLPSDPRFTLRLRLAKPNLLYLRQRQRAWLFACLILASTFTSLIGFIAARRAFERQRGLSEMKSNFVSSVSHELRAPIASVRLMAENLERGAVSEVAKQRDYYHFIGLECRRLASLIENVLDFARIEHGRKEYDFESVDLEELTRRTVQLMDPYAAERHVKLVFILPGGIQRNFQSYMDAQAMQQVLINLIDNAIKHSPHDAMVTIGLEAPNDGSATAKLWVEDQGQGIPPEEHEKIFERFYRVGSELRRQTHGVGIGLSIVKHVVEAHHGQISLRSAVGQGSRFTIEVALEQTQEPANLKSLPALKSV